jgi:hypothetical protein
VLGLRVQQQKGTRNQDRQAGKEERREGRGGKEETNGKCAGKSSAAAPLTAAPKQRKASHREERRS